MMTDRPDRENEHLDWALGELDPERAAATRQRIRADPEAALEAAEVRALLEDMRTLTVEPSGEVELAVRYAWRRRLELRRAGGLFDAGRRARGFGSAGACLRVAAVAAALLVGLLFLQENRLQPQLRRQAARSAPAALDVRVARSMPIEPRDPVLAPETASPLVASPGTRAALSAGGASLRRHYASLEDLEETDVFTRLVSAKNDLAVLRMEFRNRFSRSARRRSIAMSGGLPDLEDRIQDLAQSIAMRVETSGDLSVASTALALRALLATGSSLRVGHRGAVRFAVDKLESQLADLGPGELASALAALTDVAVMNSGHAADLVGKYAEKLARTILSPSEVRSAHHAGTPDEVAGMRRPELLRFGVPVAALADAGHVLRLAPAFGVHPSLARDARLLVAAHVEERLARDGRHRPDLLAAQLYGFGDLVDRPSIDRRLLLWKPHLLVRENFVAVHHLTWSQYPPRAGWAAYARELRELATIKAPDDVGDAAALLLSLAMNFAAPGIHQVLDVAG